MSKMMINHRALSLLLLAFILAASVMFLVNRVEAAGYVDVTVWEAKAIVDADPSVVILDVRNESEYVAGHIRNAKLIPLFELEARIDELNATDEVLVYCKIGGRSSTAGQILVDKGFQHVYNMLGGMTDWIREEYPVYVKYGSIQQAIDDAAEGSTLYVSAGQYREHLTINKSLSLVGENQLTTEIDGTNNGTIFYVNADSVSISDFKIEFCGCACKGFCGVNIESHHQNISITNNHIFSDGYGIQMDKASRIMIAYNNITNNSDSVIFVNDSSDVLIFENNIAQNFDGIWIDNSTNITVLNNNITASVNAIAIEDAGNNTVVGNYISGNIIYGFYISQSNNNRLYHNSMMQNGRHVSTRNSTSLWDNGLEGNYWSNYTGDDIDFDGIGDTPHVIDADSIDNHPLTGLFYMFPTAVSGSIFEIISNSTVSRLEYDASNGTISLQVSNTTANQTVGFCRISIPHAVMNPINDSISVVIDNGQTPVLLFNSAVYDNGTHRWICFAYPHSTHEILIIPEYPHLPFIAVLVSITLVTASVCIKRKLRRRVMPSLSSGRCI